ncbi:MAG: hypothetical protein J0H32_02120 [Rhizobiales bacterium]|nr:hypothetical protein [Hyphomicrobiales bacterium]MBN8983271.1 hypothetical protein [Hyphomicrobiales bacterium]
MAVSTNTFSSEENGVYESRPVAEACLRYDGGKHRPEPFGSVRREDRQSYGNLGEEKVRQTTSFKMIAGFPDMKL